MALKAPRLIVPIACSSQPGGGRRRRFGVGDRVTTRRDTVTVRTTSGLPTTLQGSRCSGARILSRMRPPARYPRAF